MRVKKLSTLQRPALLEVPLGSLPECVRMTGYARNKAFAISAAVRELYGESYEWYGFTLAEEERPELITDIGLPRNASNLLQYTRLDTADLLAFQEHLSAGSLINGWIHSHGDLQYHGFSPVDEANHRTVLEYVASKVRRPVVKREIRIEGLTVLQDAAWDPEQLKKGTVTVLTDEPVGRARILETVYGSFCFALVIGDAGWMQSQIVTKRRGILTGWTLYGTTEAPLEVQEPSRALTAVEKEDLMREVQRKIRPPGADPPEVMERL